MKVVLRFGPREIATDKELFEPLPSVIQVFQPELICALTEQEIAKVVDQPIVSGWVDLQDTDGKTAYYKVRF